MNKKVIFQFLRDLEQNNSKEWMDANRGRYENAKAIWCEEIQLYLNRLVQYDEQFEFLKPKDTIMRINNNRVFQPDRPTYKDSFGFDPKKGRMQSSFYIHLSPNGSFIAGGFYHPPKEILQQVRAAVDYNGQDLIDIISEESFLDYFGGLMPDPNQLKKAPKGYAIDHPHIKLLRRKSFTVMKNVTEEEFTSDQFIEEVEKAYLIMKPFNEYLDEAARGI